MLAHLKGRRHLDDALMKLKALAAFAGTYGDAFHRIEALAETDGRMKVIDMKTDAARRVVAVREESPAHLYRSESPSPTIPGHRGERALPPCQRRRGKKGRQNERVRADAA